MTEAERYRWCHRVLGSAKRAGWKISRTSGGCWRLHHPSGAGLTLAPRPTARGLLAAEAAMLAIERQHQSTTAGGAPAQLRTER